MDEERPEGKQSTEDLRQEIAVATKNQRKRQGIKNAALLPQQIAEFCQLTGDCKKLLDNAILRYGFSPRAVSSCLKVSRTIADMADSPTITPDHLTEAINYRKLCSDLIPET